MVLSDVRLLSLSNVSICLSKAACKHQLVSGSHTNRTCNGLWPSCFFLDKEHPCACEDRGIEHRLTERRSRVLYLPRCSDVSGVTSSDSSGGFYRWYMIDPRVSVAMCMLA